MDATLGTGTKFLNKSHPKATATASIAMIGLIALLRTTPNASAAQIEITPEQSNFPALRMFEVGGAGFTPNTQLMSTTNGVQIVPALCTDFNGNFRFTYEIDTRIEHPSNVPLVISDGKSVVKVTFNIVDSDAQSANMTPRIFDSNDSDVGWFRKCVSFVETAIAMTVVTVITLVALLSSFDKKPEIYHKHTGGSNPQDMFGDRPSDKSRYKTPGFKDGGD